MASVVNRPNGRREVQFKDAHGKRQTLRLGKIPKRDAEAIKTRVEHLLAAQLSRQPLDGDTAKWVAGIDDVLADRLAAVGLIRQRESVLLAEFVEEYLNRRTDYKPATLVRNRQTQRYLVAFFGADRNLRDITDGDADDWRLFLLQSGLSDNTIRKHVQIAKQFFSHAVRKKLIESNPLSHLKSTVQGNPDRYHFVTREVADKVLDACPDAEWRLIFALSRYGGLRCPSEHLELTWDCINWEQDRLRIPSPKTEHHAGKSSRTIPLFPELRQHLEDAFQAAPDGSVHVIRRYRDRNANLRTQLLRIIERAGVEPWPKLFQNLRSTRQTELAETFPLHVVTEWVGNSDAVAMKHYLQVTDDHFRKATQNPTQTVHDSSVRGMTAKQQTPQKSAVDNAGQVWTPVKVGDEGLEPPTLSV